MFIACLSEQKNELNNRTIRDRQNCAENNLLSSQAIGYSDYTDMRVHLMGPSLYGTKGTRKTVHT